jgi:hypothetical protein
MASSELLLKCLTHPNKNWHSCMQVGEQEKPLSLEKNQELASPGEICHCTCPMGVGASHLPQRCPFYSIIMTWMPSLSTSTTIDDIFIYLGGNRLKIIVVNKVSILNTKFIVLLDTQL